VSSDRFMKATGWTPLHPDAIVGLKATAEQWRSKQ
jgi:hypothetical protein